MKAIDKAIRACDELNVTKQEYEAAISMIKKPVHKTSESQIRAAQEVIRKYKEQQSKIKTKDEFGVYEIIYSSKKDSPRSLAYVPGESENEALNNLKKKYSVDVVHSIKKTSKNSRMYKQAVAMASVNNKFD